MKEKTQANVFKAFVGEAKAYFRLLAYAEKAEEEELPQIALLFRAIADAERVHATRQLNLVKDLVVKDTDTNLEESFQRENRSVRTNIPTSYKMRRKRVRQQLLWLSAMPGMPRASTPSSMSVPS